MCTALHADLHHTESSQSGPNQLSTSGIHFFLQGRGSGQPFLIHPFYSLAIPDQNKIKNITFKRIFKFYQ